MYHIVVGTIDGITEELFGSFVKQDCTYELDAEKESWKEQGYKKIKMSTRETSDSPDKEVYGEKHYAVSEYERIEFNSLEKAIAFTEDEDNGEYEIYDQYGNLLEFAQPIH